MRPDEERRSGRLAEFKWSSPRICPGNGSRSAPRESLLACMPANREPSNQSFEIDREATVCTASRRFSLKTSFATVFACR